MTESLRIEQSARRGTLAGKPDLEHSKAAVLPCLGCPDSRRGYQRAIDEFALGIVLLNMRSSCIHGAVCFRGSRWQGKVECRAAPAVAAGPDPSAMRFDDRLTDRQAHAAALWFCSKERVK